VFPTFTFSVPALDLHSFPTRRSSDLLWFLNPAFTAAPIRLAAGLGPRGELRMLFFDLLIPRQHALEAGVEGRGDLRSAFQRRHRSEEHTSELQSLAYLVCRLLLEKKK